MVANFDEELKAFKGISPLCEVTSKKWFDIVWQDGNVDLIFDDFEMIPAQTIDLDPMMEFRVENSVETQGDFVEPEEQIDKLAGDSNDDIIDENTKETVKADSLEQNDLEDVSVELDNLYQKIQAQF